MTLDDFLALFDYSTPAGNGFNVECPAHIDKKASLSVTDGKKGIVLFCQAGCSTDAICAQLGITTADLFNQPINQNGSGNGHRKAKDWTVTAVYPYHREDGSWAYEIRRTASKDFLYFRKNDQGEWICGHSAGEYWFSANQSTWFQIKPSTKLLPSTLRRTYPEGEKLLYRLPELITAPLNQAVIIVEGEKDVNRCYKEGFVATCNPLGAGTNKWLDKFSEHFEGRKVVIIPDNDPPDTYDPATGKTTKGFHGQRHAKRILDSLEFHAAFRKVDIQAAVLELQGLPIKGDISDWFDGGHTVVELKQLIDDKLAQMAQGQQSQTNVPTPPNPPSQSASGNPQPQPAKNYNTTDMGNAERFADKFGDVVRYCSKLGKDGVWLIWDGRRWQADEKLKIHGMAKQIVPDIYADAQLANYKADKERLFEWAIRTEGLGVRNNMVKDARPALAIAAEELDTHPWLLNVKNGTIDLRTGKLQPHAQTDYLTKMLQIEYDENAKCEAWIEFINTAQWDKQEMIDYLQKAVGYSLTGDTGEKCMFILHGPKDTGKSTFVEMMQMLLGEYAVKIQTQTLMWRREKQQSNDIATLKGARFVHASEAEEHERLAEAQIKEMTGGDTITARFLHAEFFQFQPEFKLWLSTNHKPKASNDEALWSRLKLIPFTYQIAEDQKDRKLKQKLKAELPGILKWAIDGCLKWQAEGLSSTADIAKATGQYRQEMDTIGHFLADCCEIDDPSTPGYVTAAKDLYNAYKQWCIEAGERPDSQRALGLKLKDRGLQNEMITSGSCKGRTEWLGIRLR